jgi:ribonuclease BN (tRNA processing enzyme)
LAHDGDEPQLIIDAGTGIRNASALLSGPFQGAVLLGHLHWDHTQGLPFFEAGDTEDAEVALYAPTQAGETAGQADIEGLLGKAMSPPHFPIAPSGLRGSWSFTGLEEGESQIGGFSVLALEVPHKGGRTFGYRVSDGQAVIAYLSDHCPTLLGPGPAGLGEYHEAALRLALGCDVLFHDAQYTDDELATKTLFGHSSYGYALGLAEAAGAKRVVFYHHDPQRSDEQLDAIMGRYQQAPVQAEAAVEGTVVEITAGA